MTHFFDRRKIVLRNISKLINENYAKLGIIDYIIKRSLVSGLNFLTLIVKLNARNFLQKKVNKAMDD